MKQTVTPKNKKITITLPVWERYPNLLPYSMLMLGALLLYGWTYNFDYGFDDNYFLNTLKLIGNNLSDAPYIFFKRFGAEDYRPVPVLTFWIERYINGKPDPHLSHLVNVFLFGFLLTRIYRFVIVSRFYEDARKIRLLALLTALIFLVHPNHVSVVANIKSRDNILSMTFGLMSAIQFLKMLDDKKWWHIPLVIVFLVLAFLSKMDSYVFTITPLLFYLLYRKPNWKVLLVVVVATFFLFRTAYNFRSMLFTELGVQFQHVRTTLDSPVSGNNSFPDMLSLSCITMLYYLKFLTVPWGYYFYFGYNQVPLRPLFHPINFLAAGIYLSIGAACIYALKKDKIYLFSFLFFLAAIAYASNLYVAVAGIIMDRYNFIPSLGFCLALAALMIRLTQRSSAVFFINKWMILVLAVYAAFTIYRTSAWKDKLTLYTRDIGHLTQSAHALYIVSAVYVNKMLFEDLDNTSKEADVKTAEKYIDQSLAISDRYPGVWQAKGICNLYKGENQLALEEFRKAMSLDSNYLSAINYIGVAFRNLNRDDSAYVYFHYVMERETYYGYAADNLLQLLIRNKRKREADSVMQVLQNRFPNDVNYRKRMMELRSGSPK